METYHSDVIGCFIWEFQETSYRSANGTSWTLRRITETSWWRTAETPFGASFETCFRRCGNVLMGRHHNVLLRRRHDIIMRHGDVPLRRLGDAPVRRRWTFHLRHTATLLGRTERHRYDVTRTSCCQVGNLWFTLGQLTLKKL